MFVVNVNRSNKRASAGGLLFKLLGVKKQANLGEDSSFYFDEKLGRWIDKVRDIVIVLCKVDASHEFDGIAVIDTDGSHEWECLTKFDATTHVWHIGTSNPRTTCT